MTSVFFSYSHKDEELRDQLEVHLAMLKRQGFIEAWHDRRIPAGDNLDDAISEKLEEADIILLLVSPDFLASEYCYAVEMERAMERHRAGEARVIPVILRRSDWHDAPFGKLNATPPDGKPIRSYADLDEAFHDVTKAIKAALPKKAAAEPVRDRVAPPAPPAVRFAGGEPQAMPGPRTSNLRLAKSFTDADKDHFLDESFIFIRHFFRNSLDELKARNAGIDTSYREIDANRFSAIIYKEGKAVARGSIRLNGNSFGTGIFYSNSDRDNSFNEQLNVEADDHALFLRSLMRHSMGGQRDTKLTSEGAAEHLWSMLIEHLQGYNHN